MRFDLALNIVAVVVVVVDFIAHSYTKNMYKRDNHYERCVLYPLSVSID
jgi:Na+-translocating ferredoxin:NAD+ oxidoreductase RnfE subunit